VSSFGEQLWAVSVSGISLLNLRTQLGKTAFEAAVSSVVDEASTANLVALLDDWS
jgi:hypothetical protein